MTIAWVKGENDNFDKLLKRFNKKVEEDNIIPEVKRRQFFESKSEKRKRKEDSLLKSIWLMV